METEESTEGALGPGFVSEVTPWLPATLLYCEMKIKSKYFSLPEIFNLFSSHLESA